MSWFANGAARKVLLSRSILVFINWYIGIPHQHRQPSWAFLVLVTPDSVAVTEMLNKSANLFEHMFIYCSFAYFFLQSSLAEWVNPRSWATVYYGVRSLHILGKISCEYESFYISSFYKLTVLFLWKYLIIPLTYNRISSGRNRIMWSKMKSTACFSWSKATTCPRSVKP